MPVITLIDLGCAITDIFAFLRPAVQHNLRRTSFAMCEWFDSAAENGSLAFFVTYAPSDTATGPLRWRHTTWFYQGYRGGIGQRSDMCYKVAPPETIVMTLHARNSCQSVSSTENDYTIDNAAIQVPDFPFEHKLIITGLFGIRSIGDNFCNWSKAVRIEFKCDSDQLRSVGSGWMSNCPLLKSVTFSGFTQLENVGDGWMCNCAKLDSVTFVDELSKLKRVGKYWMSNCSNLRSITFSELTALEEVGRCWLRECVYLESVAFVGGMPRLVTIGSGWLSDCPKLKEVDLAAFPAMAEVGDDSLSDYLQEILAAS